MTANNALSWQLASTSVLPNSSVSNHLFFFDAALPTAARNIHHVYAPVTKLGVVLEGNQPWEGDTVSAFCGSLVRLDDGSYRLYYTTVNDHDMHLAIAESADGLHWVKPELGQQIIDGISTNHIVLTGVPQRQDQVGQPQVLRLPDGRWRMYYWHHQHGWGRMPYLYTIAESADGLRWHVPDYNQWALNSHWLGDQSALTVDERLNDKARRTNDANFVYYNPRLQCYEQFSQWFLDAIPERRVAEDNVPNFNRMIQRRVSADGITWSAPELIVQADAHDPWDQQFYHLAMQYHEDWLIGSIGHYRVENAQQTMDMELIFSRDGRQWQRPLRGGFIPRDPDGRDSEGVYPTNAWVDRGDNWLCLYTATARKHNQSGKADLPYTCVMAATWAKQRFVGLQAGNVTGGFMTPAFYLQHAEITLDADVRGWLRAELCDAWGRKLEGYHLEHSSVTHGDSTTHVLRWADKDTASLRHDPLRLRLEYSDGVVYGVTF